MDCGGALVFFFDLNFFTGLGGVATGAGEGAGSGVAAASLVVDAVSVETAGVIAPSAEAGASPGGVGAGSSITGAA